MALPPTIPTSFVPKQPVTTTARRRKSGMNVLLLASLALGVVSALAAGAAFGYQTYLKSSRDAKEAQLKEAEQAVNLDTVEEFIRLRNRLVSSQTLLDQHVTLSRFFDVLESRTLQTVRFSTLDLSVNEDRTAEVLMEGTARSFNALAAQSAAFAAEKRIKRAIFSDISVNTNGTVGFSLTATIDERLVTAADALPGIEQAPATIPTAPFTPPVSTPAATSAPATGTQQTL